LNYSAQKTMRLAQQLYEGVEIKGSGTVALITYLRTDSVRVSDEAQRSAREFITKYYGAEYAAGGSGEKKPNASKVQDAHEAIRPTDIDRTPSDLKNALPRDLYRLYQLIWKRFCASQMTPAVYTTISADFVAGGYVFRASDATVKFPGFMSVYTEAEENVSADAKPESKTKAPAKTKAAAKKKEGEDGKVLAQLQEKDNLNALSYEDQQHFTQPPAHYTEASLVRMLEEKGIGRPSTYAPTISTIMGRHYITKEQRNLYVTELGEAVNKLMKDAFPSIVDADFTANMESLLDAVEAGDVEYKTVIRNFYPDLHEAVEKAEKELESVKIEDEVSDVQCDQCGRMMVIKYGPHGKFLACPGFPECRNTKPYFEKIGLACPNCGGDIVIKRTRKGRRYFGCVNNPECDYMVWQRPTKESLEKENKKDK
nr:topoisomerase DNA-binding C4 zinc finger domain-containing protein [Lachnospiraceae bacterium]